MAGRSRRSAVRLVGLGAVFALLILRPWQRLGEAAFHFETASGAEPFRYLTRSGGQSSAAPVDWMTIGLAPAATPDEAGGPHFSAAALCRALIGDWRPGSALPITYFTDTYCPNCRAQDRELDVFLASTSRSISLRTREFPIFGEPSSLAAKAVLAAERQDAGAIMRDVLLRAAPVRDLDTLIGRAAAAGLDPERFREDFGSPAILEQLAVARAMARRLGMAGTPSMIVGRTIVVGVLDARHLAALVALEADEGPASCPNS
jgi:predicted DsbA family dithiol-disulfide isomerase